MCSRRSCAPFGAQVLEGAVMRMISNFWRRVEDSLPLLHAKAKRFKRNRLLQNAVVESLEERILFGYTPPGGDQLPPIYVTTCNGPVLVKSDPNTGAPGGQ